MRIVILGTGPFAVPSCQRILADGHDVPVVVVRPLVDPTAKKLPPTPVLDWARDNQLPTFQPASINDPAAIAELATYQPDLLFVCDYGQILSNDCLRVAPYGGINLHGSLLPRHRGAAPVQWALLRGDDRAGVSVIHMTPRLDAGPVLSTAETMIEPDENAGQLEPRLALLGVEATAAAISQLSDWDQQVEIGTLQTKAGVTRAPRFMKAQGQLDFRLPAEYLVRLIRALQPWPGTFAEMRLAEGKSTRMLVRAARAVNVDSGKAAGQAWSCDTRQLGLDWPSPWQQVLAVATGSGTILVSRLQPASKREMDAEEFMRGHSLFSGATFVLPEPPLSELQ